MLCCKRFLPFNVQQAAAPVCQCRRQQQCTCSSSSSTSSMVIRPITSSACCVAPPRVASKAVQRAVSTVSRLSWAGRIVGRQSGS